MSNGQVPYTVKKKFRDSFICFDQTFLGLGMGKLFPARESLVIPAGAGNTAKPFFTVYHQHQTTQARKSPDQKSNSCIKGASSS